MSDQKLLPAPEVKTDEGIRVVVPDAVETQCQACHIWVEHGHTHLCNGDGTFGFTWGVKL